jgi:hypothetical protein
MVLPGASRLLEEIPMPLTVRSLTAVPVLVLWASLAWGEAAIQIQLHDIIAPAVYPDGRRTTTTITFFLGVARDRDLKTICNRLPTVRDALVVAINREPVPAIGRYLDAQRAAPRLKKAVNDALGAALVLDVNMIPGVPREKTHIVPRGGGDQLPSGSKVPSPSYATGTTGCRRVGALPPEVAQQARAVLTARASEVETQARALAPGQPEATPSPREKPPTAPLARAPALPPGTKCDRRVEEFWPFGEHIVAGDRYRLERVFTVDDDRDGRVENVGFLLRAPGRPDLLMFYFDAEGKPSAATVLTLKRDDDGDIGRLCFGQVFYGTAESAQEAARRSGAPARPGQSALPGFVTLLIATAGAAGILLGAGALVGFLIARKRKTDRRQRLERRFSERRKGPDPRHTGAEQRSGKDRRSGQDRRQQPDRRGH